MTDESIITSFDTFLRKNGRSKSTRTAYTTDIRQFLHFFEGTIEKLHAGDIESFLEKLQSEHISNKTISRKLNSLRTFSNYLFREKILENDVGKEVPHPEVESPTISFFSRDEFLKMRYAANEPQISLLFELLLQTGMQISEALEVTIEDIDLENNYIKLADREVALTNKAASALTNFLDNTSRRKRYLFRGENTQQLNVRVARSKLDGLMAEAKVRGKTVNDIRNTFIVEQLKVGVPIDVIAKQVGHSTLASTERYLLCLEQPYKESGIGRIVEL